jgi:hypothetical protein
MASTISIILAGILGGTMVLVSIPRQKCPKCLYLLPRFRKFITAKQYLSGMSFCPNCHSIISRKGHLIDR